MLLAAILFLFPVPQSGDTAKIAVNRSAEISRISSGDSSFSQPVVSAPEPKVKRTRSWPAGLRSNRGYRPAAARAGPAVMPFAPLKPAATKREPDAEEIVVRVGLCRKRRTSIDAWSTARNYTGIRRGREPATSAVFALRRDVRGDASESAPDGFYRQAHDDQPARVDSEYVVAAAVGRDWLFVVCRRAQRATGALVESKPPNLCCAGE